MARPSNLQANICLSQSNNFGGRPSFSDDKKDWKIENIFDQEDSSSDAETVIVHILDSKCEVQLQEESDYELWDVVSNAEPSDSDSTKGQQQPNNSPITAQPNSLQAEITATSNISTQNDSLPPAENQKRRVAHNFSDKVKLAIRDLKNGLSYREASEKNGISKSALHRHTRNKNKFANAENSQLGRTTVFSAEIENELVEYVLEMQEHFYGLTMDDIKSLAYDIAELNAIPNNFNRITKRAGRTWYYKFMRRHPEITLRQPRATSMARIKGFNPSNVKDFQTKLQALITENNICADKIWNMDESGFTAVQKKCRRVLARKGQKIVGTACSGERGVNTTIVCCFNAEDRYVPPMLIFKGKRTIEDMVVPKGAIVEMAESGYINSELFHKWLVHFVAHVQPSMESKVLLILDGHSTHTLNLAALKYARLHGVVLLSLPAHTTHRLQPLDVGFFKPLGTHFISEVEKWLRSHPGRTIPNNKIGPMLTDAYNETLKNRNIAKNSFRACGIWPVDFDKFNETDFPAFNSSPVVSSTLTIPIRKIAPVPKINLANQSYGTRAAELTSQSHISELERKNAEKFENKRKKVTNLITKLSKLGAPFLIAEPTSTVSPNTISNSIPEQIIKTEVGSNKNCNRKTRPIKMTTGRKASNLIVKPQLKERRSVRQKKKVNDLLSKCTTTINTDEKPDSISTNPLNDVLTSEPTSLVALSDNIQGPIIKTENVPVKNRKRKALSNTMSDGADDTNLIVEPKRKVCAQMKKKQPIGVAFIKIEPTNLNCNILESIKNIPETSFRDTERRSVRQKKKEYVLSSLRTTPIKTDERTDSIPKTPINDDASILTNELTSMVAISAIVQGPNIKTENVPVKYRKRKALPNKMSDGGDTNLIAEPKQRICTKKQKKQESSELTSNCNILSSRENHPHSVRQKKKFENLQTKSSRRGSIKTEDKTETTNSKSPEKSIESLTITGRKRKKLQEEIQCKKSPRASSKPVRKKIDDHDEKQMAVKRPKLPNR